jgi:HEAT repeat protein
MVHSLAVGIVLCALAQESKTRPSPASPDQSALVQKYLKDLRDEDPSVAHRAADALEKIGSPSVVQALLRIVKEDKDAPLRSFAFKTMYGCGPNAIPAMFDLLTYDKFDPDDLQISSDVPAALASFGKEALPDVMKILDDPKRSRYARGRAMCVIDEMTGFRTLTRVPEAKVAIPSLVKFVAGRDKQLARQAALVLGYFGPAANSAIPTLMKYLKDVSREEQAGVALSLFRISAKNNVSLPTLLDILKNGPDAVSRNAAVGALGWTQDTSDETVTALTGALADPSTQRQAAGAFLLLNRVPDAAVPILEKMLDDPDKSKRHLANLLLEERERMKRGGNPSGPKRSQ